MRKRWGLLFTFLGVIIGILLTRDPRNKRKVFVLGPYWASIRLAVPERGYKHQFMYYKMGISAGHVYANEVVIYLLQKALLNINWGRRASRFKKHTGTVYLGSDYNEWLGTRLLHDDIARLRGKMSKTRALNIRAQKTNGIG